MRGPVLLQWLTLLSLLLYFWASVGKSAQDQMWKNGRHEPWSSGYGRHLLFERLRVQIPAQYTGWTGHFFTLICCKNCIDCLKRPKMKEKEAGVGPFFKKNLRKWSPESCPPDFKDRRKWSPASERSDLRKWSPESGPDFKDLRKWSPESCPDFKDLRKCIPESWESLSDLKKWDPLDPDLRDRRKCDPSFFWTSAASRSTLTLTSLSSSKSSSPTGEKIIKNFLFNFNLLSNSAFSR